MALDELYTQLAHAIDQAGPAKRETFLAMLSLKLLSQQMYQKADQQAASELIQEVLAQAIKPQGGSDTRYIHGQGKE
jgi:hypothetical protein